MEASALVVQDGLFLTTNDSGDTGRVFVVDRTGATVGVTHWSEDPTDVEALAPAGPGSVWVGDIGDNLASRPDVTITRVPVGRGDRTVQPTSYRLTYPHGAHRRRDPDPRPGDRAGSTSPPRTSSAAPSTPYRGTSPRPGPTDSREVGHVLSIATDGSFFPDGRHLIVRDYSSATVYDWPSLQRVGSFDLPSQQQGEGIAVGPDDTLYLSSEGIARTGPRDPAAGGDPAGDGRPGHHVVHPRVHARVLARAADGRPVRAVRLGLARRLAMGPRWPARGGCRVRARARAASALIGVPAVLRGEGAAASPH